MRVFYLIIPERMSFLAKSSLYLSRTIITLSVVLFQGTRGEHFNGCIDSKATLSSIQTINPLRSGLHCATSCNSRSDCAGFNLEKNSQRRQCDLLSFSPATTSCEDGHVAAELNTNFYYKRESPSCLFL